MPNTPWNGYEVAWTCGTEAVSVTSCEILAVPTIASRPRAVEVLPVTTERDKQLFSSFFDNFFQRELILRHHVFNENEAAEYCRCSVSCIRYHATRSRKLAFLKLSKEGLVFLKTDLETFLERARVEGFRDHS